MNYGATPYPQMVESLSAEIDKFETEIEYNRNNDTVVVRSPVNNIATKKLVPSDLKLTSA